MERLRQKDADTGMSERSVTDAQKNAIAEARNLYSSKVAQLEILHRTKMSTTFDPGARAQADADYRRELQRLKDDVERQVEKIRGQGD